MQKPKLYLHELQPPTRRDKSRQWKLNQRKLNPRNMNMRNMNPCKMNLFTLFILSLTLVFISACSITGYRSNKAKIPNAVYHRVKPGESMQDIARRHKVDVGEIALLNGITTIDKAPAGQLLLVKYSKDAVAQQKESDSSGWIWSPTESSSTGSGTKKPSTKPNYSNDSKEDNGSAFGSGWGRVPSDQNASLVKGRFAWPLAGGQVISGFGQRSGRPHDGVDIMAEEGTPIYAAHNAKVVYADDKIPGYGNMIVLRGSDGFSSVYAHARRLLVGNGDRVSRGQKIGEVGQTGRAAGPHLHFEVRRLTQNGKYLAIDPLPFFLSDSPRYAQNYGDKDWVE